MPAGESRSGLDGAKLGVEAVGTIKFGEIDAGVAVADAAKLGATNEETTGEGGGRLSAPMPWIGGGGGTRRRNDGCSGGGVNGDGALGGRSCNDSLAGSFLLLGSGATKRGMDGERKRQC